jgi:hypothetical protein
VGIGDPGGGLVGAGETERDAQFDADILGGSGQRMELRKGTDLGNQASESKRAC